MVQITAPARLHLGFFDLHGGIGRRFGGLGVTLSEINTRLSCERSATFEGSGPDADRAVEYAKQLLHLFGRTDSVRINVHEAIPRHAGLGSGTQLALAVGFAINHLFELNLSIREIAVKLGRGMRSGIGIGAFEQGGFLMDGGRSEGAQPSQIIARHSFPEHWRIVLLLSRDGPSGLADESERIAFSELPQFPQASAAHLCHLAVMQILPALMEEDLNPFANGIGRLQQVMGNYFAPAQGDTILNPQIANLLKQARLQGFEGVGQSSWGPTGFVLADSETQAHTLVRKLQVGQEVEARIVSASDCGYTLTSKAAQGNVQRQAS